MGRSDYTLILVHAQVLAAVFLSEFTRVHDRLLAKDGLVGGSLEIRSVGEKILYFRLAVWDFEIVAESGKAAFGGIKHVMGILFTLLILQSPQIESLAVS